MENEKNRLIEEIQTLLHRNDTNKMQDSTYTTLNMLDTPQLRTIAQTLKDRRETLKQDDISWLHSLVDDA